MTDEEFNSDFFLGNRVRLRKLFSGTAPVVITANGIMQRSGSSTFEFAQDRNFWYLTGIDEPDVILVMDKAKEYLIMPERSDIRAKFDGVIDAPNISHISGIGTILDNSTGWKQLSSRLKKVKHIATLAPPPIYVEQLGFYSNPARSQLSQKLKNINPTAELLDLREHLMRLRSRKQDIELRAINRAISITLATLRQISNPKQLKKYSFEYEIEAAISASFRSNGADGHAFLPIVASGKNACTIHYLSNNSRLDNSDLVTIDVGAEFQNYAADITRTYSIGGQPKPRQRAVYAAVKEAQDYALTLLRPGVIIKDYEKEMQQYMGEKLRELGLIKFISNETVRRYAPHQVSHFLGLDVHDTGDYLQPLESNMVVTCEPGIYIPEEGIGVRIEDDVLITPKGNKVLSRNLPRSLD